jgi:hypothetical protein
VSLSKWCMAMRTVKKHLGVRIERDGAVPVTWYNSAAGRLYRCGGDTITLI